MNPKTSMIIVVLLLCLTLSPSHPPASVAAQAEPYPYHYAYLSHTRGDNFIIQLVDPVTHQVSKRFSIDEPIGVYQGLASPDGRWMAIVPENSPSENLQLINLASGETIKIPVNLGLRQGDDSFSLGNKSRVVWSPDSRFLAVVMLVNDKVEVILIDPLAEGYRQITQNNDFESALAWSSDSIRLAMASEQCNFPPCDYRLEVFDSSQQAVITSFQVNTNPGIDLAHICEISWSPDNEHIVFMSSCDSSVAGFTKEVYLARIGETEIQQLTHFNDTPVIYPNAPLYNPLNLANYHPFWYDAQNLLIGTTFLAAPDDFQSLTLLYNVSNHSSTIISNEHAQEWTQNPISGELAYLATQGIEGQFSAVHIADLTNNGLEITQTLPAGCDLSWSPDGMYLAYLRRKTEFTICRFNRAGDASGLTIFDSLTGQSIQLETPDAYWTYPVGWVLAE